MLTPVDIENKEFAKAFRGYDVYEVEEFMKTLVADYEKLYRENGELKEKNAMLNEAIGSYKGMEETMQNAILVAQRTAEDIKQNAYERSETIVKDAERRAAETIDTANRAISGLEKTYLGMQREMNGFKAKMSALLSTYMQLLKEMPEQSAPSTQSRFEPAPAPTAPPAAVPKEPEPENKEDTNTFNFSSLPKEPGAHEAAPAAKLPEEPPTWTPIPGTEKKKKPIASAPATGFQTERKLNPMVEELLRKKKEEQEAAQREESQEAAAAEENTAAADTGFSVTKETIQKEPKSQVSSINVEDLKAYDVFKDDTL